MALTKINNNTLSAITTLPAAIATGKVLQVEKFINQHDVTTTSTSFSTFETFSFTPLSASSTIYFHLALQYQLYGNTTDTSANGCIAIVSEATGSDVTISAQEFYISNIFNTNTAFEEESGYIAGSQASQGTSAFNINLKFKKITAGRIRVFPSADSKVNPITLTVMEVI
jgi:hypothetical protein